MSKYHKIQTVYKRDPENRYKTLLIGEFAHPAFGYLCGNDWLWTEKVDGTNIRVIWNGQAVQFGGRTDNAQLHSGLLQHLIEQFPSEKCGEVFGEVPAVIYGEGYGAKIQKGGAYLADRQGFIAFDVFIGMWLERPNVEDIAGKFSVPVVPVVGRGSLLEGMRAVECGMPSKLRKEPAEGLVMRPTEELLTRRGDRVITKIKRKDFPR